MTKLQRYYVDDNHSCFRPNDVHWPGWCKSADVSALEAENERLRGAQSN